MVHGGAIVVGGGRFCGDLWVFVLMMDFQEVMLTMNWPTVPPPHS